MRVKNLSFVHAKNQLFKESDLFGARGADIFQEVNSIQTFIYRSIRLSKDKRKLRRFRDFIRKNKKIYNSEHLQTERERDHACLEK